MTVDKGETDRSRRQRAERALNRTLGNAGSDAVRDGCVSGFCVTREQGGASPRLVAMMRESDTDTSNASLGSTLEGAYAGTSNVRPLQFPFVVSLERSLGSSSEQYCGGTLIHPKWVLTSAGCVAGMNLTDVVSSHVAVLGGHQCVKGSVETRQECFANQVVCSGRCDGECQGNISQSGTSGTFSVGGPNSTYVNNANCTWLVSSVAEITISFSFFDIEPGSDFVTINRCSSPTCGTVEQVAQLSGNSSLSTYTSPTGYLQVVFTSDDNGTAAGFIASWKTPFTGGTTRARLSRVVIHPLYQVDQHYDVALIELEHEILGFEPAPLDDGSDLGFPPCKHPTLTTVGWWPSTQEELTTEELTAGGLWASPPSWDALDIDVDECVSVEEFNAYCDAMGCDNVTFNDVARASSDDNTCPPTTFSRADYTELTMGIDMNSDSTPIRRQTLEHVDSEACRQHHLDAQGFQEVGTDNLAICARAFGMSNESLETCRERGYFGQDGGALLAPLEGTPDGYVLVGVIRKGHGAAASALDNNTGNRDCPLDKLPRAHVRVAGMRQVKVLECL